LHSSYEVWRLRLFSFRGYGLALAALALVVVGAYDSYPLQSSRIQQTDVHAEVLSEKLPSVKRK